jgi:hypothetical protein
MIDLKLDEITWFSERQLSYKPRHFIIAKTPITELSKQWIFDKLKGRFCFVDYEEACTSHDMGGAYDILATLEQYPAFEDPAEATFYELTWS